MPEVFDPYLVDRAAWLREQIVLRERYLAMQRQWRHEAWQVHQYLQDELDGAWLVPGAEHAAVGIAQEMQVRRRRIATLDGDIVVQQCEVEQLRRELSWLGRLGFVPVQTACENLLLRRAGQ